MKQLTEQLARAIVRPRSRNTYKGSFGKILIIGGNAQYGGAAIMSASAAVYTGAGLVSVATDPVNRSALHARLPEAMILDASTSALDPSSDRHCCGTGIRHGHDCFENFKACLCSR